MYVNGTKIGSSTARNFYGQEISDIKYGIVAIDGGRQTNPLTVYADRLRVSSTRIAPAGPAPVPAATPPPASTTADTQRPTAPRTAVVTERAGWTGAVAWQPSSDNTRVVRYEVWVGTSDYTGWRLATTVSGDTLKAPVTGAVAGHDVHRRRTSVRRCRQQVRVLLQPRTAADHRLTGFCCLCGSAA